MPTNMKNKQIFLVAVATKKVWLQYWSAKWVLCKVRCVTRGEEGGEVSPALFQNLEKSALILEKNALTRFIYGLNVSFKMLF